MSLRNLPSVDSLLKDADGLISAYGRKLTLQAIRIVLDDVRDEINGGLEISTKENIISRAGSYLISWTTPTLQPVINGTGVILHTNLGRAPLSKTAIQAINDVSVGYSNLEFDLNSGKRGSRTVHLEDVLIRLTGAEAELVVNNCASAVLLVLSALANRKKVIIPRSQLVEIGGGFRIPDVMKQSGAKLVEIGTTNKVRLSDFEGALGSKTQTANPIVMHAHRSNFRIMGFTE